MKNKTNIEEDINRIYDLLQWADDNKNNVTTEYKAFENILKDRERLLEGKEILEDNYKILSENVSMIAKELDLEEDATIDEIYTAIRILKSKRLNMFEILESNDKAKKYDKLIEKIKQFIKDMVNREDYDHAGTEWLESEIVDYLQEILEIEEEKR